MSGTGACGRSPDTVGGQMTKVVVKESQSWQQPTNQMAEAESGSQAGVNIRRAEEVQNSRQRKARVNRRSE